MIDAYLARKIRLQGCYLPVDASYTSPRLEEIARRQQELKEEFDSLDREIREMSDSMVKR